MIAALEQKTEQPNAQWRCSKCNTRLADVKLERGVITIKCYRCGAYNTLSK